MYFKKIFDVIMPPCARGIVLHQEIFLQIVLKYA